MGGADVGRLKTMIAMCAGSWLIICIIYILYHALEQQVGILIFVKIKTAQKFVFG